MALPRIIERQWQRDVIERWLASEQTPMEARPVLLDMLRVVLEELEQLKAHTATVHSHTAHRDADKHDWPVRDSR